MLATELYGPLFPKDEYMNQININLPAIRNIAVRGVRRTAIFMGLGINAANNPDFKQYELAKLTGFEFIEPISDERTLAGLKTEFGRWIVGNGLRELIETFCIFLDEIHVACLWMSASCHKIPLNQIQTQDKKFRHKGLKDKLPHLKNTYNVTLTQPDFMISINQARHCLTHRQGSVGARDCLDSERLVVSWRGCEIYAETPSGEIISLSPMPDVGVSLRRQ